MYCNDNYIVNSNINDEALCIKRSSGILIVIMTGKWYHHALSYFLQHEEITEEGLVDFCEKEARRYGYTFTEEFELFLEIYMTGETYDAWHRDAKRFASEFPNPLDAHRPRPRFVA